MQDQPGNRSFSFYCRQAKRSLTIMISIAFILALGFSLYFPIASRLTGNPYPGLFGIRQALVMSNSMAPAIIAGDLIVIRAASDYDIGDILTYVDRQGLVTHRLIENGSNGMLLQGDANRTADRPVAPDQVLGRTILRLPAIGIVAHWLRTMH